MAWSSPHPRPVGSRGRALAIGLAAIALAACASARHLDDVDGADPDAADVDGADLDGAGADGANDAAVDGAAGDAPAGDAPAVDAPVIDAAVIDAPVIDAPVIDAAVDAAVDAPGCTNPVWTDLLGNGGFENGVAPWTQTSTIIRTASQMPFGPYAGAYAAMFGATHNANDVLVQTVTVPAGATGLRLRGYRCHVTEDLVSDADSFEVTLETPGGTVLETLESITNSDVAPVCAWTSFSWSSGGAHPGETVVLRLHGQTNLAFLTRFVVDNLALEWLGCP